MVATGSVIDEFVLGIQKKAKNLGFSLLQVPMEKVFQNKCNIQTNNPFVAPTLVELAPELSDEEVKQILTELDFIPDTKAYIHKSGLVIVSKTESGLLWYIAVVCSHQSFINQLPWAVPHKAIALRIVNMVKEACTQQPKKEEVPAETEKEEMQKEKVEEEHPKESPTTIAWVDYYLAMKAIKTL